MQVNAERYNLDRRQEVKHRQKDVKAERDLYLHRERPGAHVDHISGRKKDGKQTSEGTDEAVAHLLATVLAVCVPHVEPG